MPERFALAQQFVRLDLERAMLAAIAAKPDVYWQVIDLLHPDALTEYRQQLRTLITCIEQEKPVPPLPGVEGDPPPDPMATAKELADLYHKRLLADLVQGSLERLRGETTAVELISGLEGGLNQVQQAVRELRAGQAHTLVDLFPELLRDLTARRQAVKMQGLGSVGVTTGFGKLDKLMGGLQPGIHLLAAEPGQGKTTLTLQIAVHVAVAGWPVLFVSFEEALQRLTLRVLCHADGLEMKRYADGQADPADLERTIKVHGHKLAPLYLLEGGRRTTTALVKAKALQAMARTGSKRCLIVVDYLQRWAATVDPEALDLGDSQRRRAHKDFRHTVSALVSELRELSLRLDSPVLVISSQNRSGQGSDSLTSLKESGDLEYSADSAMFLVQSDRRAVTPPARAVDLALEKNRYGDKGRVELIFRPDLGSFREEAKR